ncbi:hypothetical protein [Dongia rigui]|uniref:Phospholipase D-like domain-containing protein n=1 Tax=Dongia rigui TaxID=940149 RepID=A0ABU5DWV3_9PROT|nr:hypothetical protein [Dongia rigui]MDY0871188.1 hypothetical protein [Dongia rigui]
MDNRERYSRLKQLIADMPDMMNNEPDMRTFQWLAAAHAVAVDPGNVMDTADHATLTTQIPHIREADDRASFLIRKQAISAVQSVLLRRLAALELKIAPSESGAFIAAGNAFDAFAAVSKVFAEAKLEILIVDPYLDSKVLEVFAVGAPEGVRMRLMADSRDVKPTFKPAVELWVKQYGAKRPVEARLSPPRTLHDRAIFVDQKRAWSLTQSFNHLAERSPASIIEVGDIGTLKIAAYESIWAAATPI